MPAPPPPPPSNVPRHISLKSSISTFDPICQALLSNFKRWVQVLSWSQVMGSNLRVGATAGSWYGITRRLVPIRHRDPPPWSSSCHGIERRISPSRWSARDANPRTPSSATSTTTTSHSRGTSAGLARGTGLKEGPSATSPSEAAERKSGSRQLQQPLQHPPRPGPQSVLLSPPQLWPSTVKLPLTVRYLGTQASAIVFCPCLIKILRTYYYPFQFQVHQIRWSPASCLRQAAASRWLGRPGSQKRWRPRQRAFGVGKISSPWCRPTKVKVRDGAILRSDHRDGELNIFTQLMFICPFHLFCFGIGWGYSTKEQESPCDPVQTPVLHSSLVRPPPKPMYPWHCWMVDWDSPDLIPDQVEVENSGLSSMALTASGAS